MAPRANWKGFLRLSLVTCPVALYPATSDTEKVSFNQINRKTGHRIKYLKDRKPGRDGEQGGDGRPRFTLPRLGCRFDDRLLLSRGCHNALNLWMSLPIAATSSQPMSPANA